MHHQEKTIIPTIEIPQANRLDLIVKLVCDNDHWPADSGRIAKVLGYERRQGAYYGTAGEILGFLTKISGGWQLTERGQGFRRLNNNQRNDLLISFVGQIPVVSLVLKEVEASGSDGLIPEELSKKLAKYTYLDNSTSIRRIQSILAWLLQLNLICKFSDMSRVWHRLYAPQSSLLNQ